MIHFKKVRVFLKRLQKYLKIPIIIRAKTRIKPKIAAKKNKY